MRRFIGDRVGVIVSVLRRRSTLEALRGGNDGDHQEDGQQTEFGFGSYTFGFLAGLLSMLSSCVMPLIPMVLGSATNAHLRALLALAGHPASVSASAGIGDMGNNLLSCMNLDCLLGAVRHWPGPSVFVEPQRRPYIGGRRGARQPSLLPYVRGTTTGRL